MKNIILSIVVLVAIASKAESDFTTPEMAISSVVEPDITTPQEELVSSSIGRSSACYTKYKKCVKKNQAPKNSYRRRRMQLVSSLVAVSHSECYKKLRQCYEAQRGNGGSKSKYRRRRVELVPSSMAEVLPEAEAALP